MNLSFIGSSLLPVFHIVGSRITLNFQYNYSVFYSILRLFLSLEGSDLPRRKNHPSLGAERRESFIRPQDDSNTLEENAPRGKILNGDSNLLHKRDRSPPISIKYSSLSIEAELARAKSVLRAIMAEGCPSNEGMYECWLPTNSL